ncbi:MAG TPA: manganese efflux pump [Streptosporangiaceae bacterium]|nr:manganese efflux pump [Streptosporangiaceae bacterium]
MLALLVVAVALGMSNFAAAVAIGLAGVDARTRLRVGVVFGAFEAGMPVLGLLIGAQAAAPLGHASRWLAAGLLIAVGGYTLAEAIRGIDPASRRRPEAAVCGSPAERTVGRSPGSGGLGRLVLSGLALSVDNLAAGFALGSYHASVVVGAVTIGAVSVTLALLGLELGARLGARAGERAGLLAGLLLIAIGVAIAAGAVR